MTRTEFFNTHKKNYILHKIYKNLEGLENLDFTVSMSNDYEKLYNTRIVDLITDKASNVEELYNIIEGKYNFYIEEIESINNDDINKYGKRKTIFNYDSLGEYEKKAFLEKHATFTKEITLYGTRTTMS